MPIPFDAAKLDRLMKEADVDLLFAVTKHNVQYLLGGYRYFFFAHADAIATCRYLPIVGYFRGRPERAFYVGAGNEAWGLEVFQSGFQISSPVPGQASIQRQSLQNSFVRRA